MPKGVEHQGAQTDRDRFVRVRVPVMPKGVEHDGNLTRRQRKA